MATWKKLLVEGLDLAGGDVINNSFTVSDSETTPNTTAITLGDTLTFAGSGDITVLESNGTVTIGFTESGEANLDMFQKFTTDNDAGGTLITPDNTTDTLAIVGESGVISTFGSDTADSITITVASGGIGTAKIADSAVTFAKIDPNAIITSTEGIASNDVDTAVPTSAAVIDYVASEIVGASYDLNVGGDTGTTTVDDSQTLSVSGTANQITTAVTAQEVTLSLPSAVVAPGSITATTTVASTTTMTAGTGLTVTTGGADVTGDSTFQNNLTVEGNLTVNGTQTILNTETLTVDDDVIVINDNAATITAQGGLQLKTTSTNSAQLLWNAASGTRLTGWLASPSGSATNLNNYLSVMEFVDTTSATNPTGNAGGVGSFHFNTADQELYIRVA